MSVSGECTFAVAFTRIIHFLLLLTPFPRRVFDSPLTLLAAFAFILFRLNLFAGLCRVGSATQGLETFARPLTRVNLRFHYGKERFWGRQPRKALLRQLLEFAKELIPRQKEPRGLRCATTLLLLVSRIAPLRVWRVGARRVVLPWGGNEGVMRDIYENNDSERQQRKQDG